MRKTKCISYLKFAVILCCAATLSSCTIVFKTSLPKSLKTRQDPRLFGKWVGQDDQGHRAFVECVRTQGQTKISFTTQDSSSSYLGYRNPIFRMVTTNINSRNYMILRYVDVSKARGFQIAKYEIDSDKLTIWILDLEKIKQAVKEGKLKGEIGTGMLPGVEITDGWAKINALLKSPNSDDFFVRVGEITKVTL